VSHIVTVSTLMKDERAIQRACKVLKMEPATHGTFEVYSRNVKGLGFKLPGWDEMCVVDLKEGKLHYDNFNGHWGDIAELHRFQQRYSLEAAKQVAEDSGQTYGEEYVENGNICFDIQEAPQQMVSVGGETGNDGPNFAL